MKRILYTGLRSPDPTYIHCPLISIVPTPKADLLPFFQAIPKASHILFTSQTAVEIFFSYLDQPLPDVQFLAIGKKTASLLPAPARIAEEETGEGVVSLLETLQIPFLLYPHSALSRFLITDYLQKKKIPHLATHLYTSVTRKVDPLPSLDEIDEIIFTSPSTVLAFLEIFGEIPQNKKISSIGPVTTDCLLALIGPNRTECF